MAKTAITEQGAPASYAGLEPEQLIRMYRLMYLSRRTDDREILLKRQQKIFFQISGAGHEALLVAAGMALKPGYDWFYPYSRDRALCLTLGQTVEEQLLQSVGAASDPSSGGRQMPSHWSIQRLNIVSQSSSVTTQCLQAVGCAEAGRYLSAHPRAAEQREGDYSAFKAVQFHGDEVVYVSLGEGATSEGEFWEAISSASSLRLPVLFVVEDNGYAIIVPVEVNTSGGNISRLVANFPNFFFAEVDGTDAEACLRVFQDAVAHCRAGLGPAFVHGHVVRPYSHSLSDDDKLYRSTAEREADAMRDPLAKLQMRLLREGILTDEQINALEKQLDHEAEEAAERALEAPLPPGEGITAHVYSADLEPTSSLFATEHAEAPGSSGGGKTGGEKGSAPRTMADLINACLHDEMRRDPRIVLYGEDVADASREEALAEVKGKGGD